jgi:hypothetical protein
MTQVLKHKRKAKKVSPKLNRILDNISGLFGKLNAQVELAFKVGKEEGFTENEIAYLVRQKMKEAGYNKNTITNIMRKIDPDLIGQQGPKNSQKIGISVNKEKEFDALDLVKKALSGSAVDIQPLKRKSAFDRYAEEEEEEEQRQQQKRKIDYQLEPEEKDFEELLAWENDLPGFPADLLLRYTKQLIKVSRELQEKLKALEMEAKK